MRKLLGHFVAWAVALVARTWRLRIDGTLPDGRAVFRLWHEDLIALGGAARGRALSVLVSRSRDGEWAASAARALGFRVVRGSSSRGAVPALRMLSRRLREGAWVALAADGPRGPRRAEQPGAGALARLGEAPLVHVAVTAWPSFRLPTWDRLLLPLPFARVTVRLDPSTSAPRLPSEAS